jgi:UDP-N-acetylmuramoylalanine--D-glutamate ligase
LGLNLSNAWKAICAYKPLPHRLEAIAKVRGVEYINDSKATNIDAMEKAIETFKRPIVLIAGGKDKGFDFSTATPSIQKQVKACVLIGEMRERIAECWKDATTCVFAETMEEAVEKAAELSSEGDLVILSPGCSSFDMFRDYKDRGDVFRRTVQKLHKI